MTEEVQAPPARPTVLQSKWRPLIGWATLGSFVYQAGGHQIANWIALNTKHLSGLESLDASTMTFVTVVLLGLAGLRTTEKVNGVAAT